MGLAAVTVAAVLIEPEQCALLGCISPGERPLANVRLTRNWTIVT